MSPTRLLASMLLVALSLATAACANHTACVQLSDAELAKLAGSATSAPVASAAAAPPSSSAVLYDLPKAADLASQPLRPSASDATSLAPMLAVEVSASGVVTCNGQTTTLDALTKIAQRTAEADPQVRAVIRADGAATHRAVMEVLDHLKQGGVSRIAFAVVAASAP